VTQIVYPIVRTGWLSEWVGRIASSACVYKGGWGKKPRIPTGGFRPILYENGTNCGCDGTDSGVSIVPAMLVRERILLAKTEP
jgi:hypothetical protein